ncbi:3-methyladenine DNA glycosylase AlkC [Paenibacillus sp. JGP012]|uniref:DNA alkylation repair protein n=1 Tax=Paenibacillus sp. JGP012 TaxID=2735914 RepID=UPI00160827D0|nr:DNA alkylation repair protein [Paenibacillus sp. JGP012]MBB6022146.1 3-methyladenine DNA glycosylase AlkC [Paenibacillus sp. JGP012]
MELFKDKYTPALVDRTADQLRQFYPQLQTQQFHELIFAEGWETLEFKARIRRITEALTQVLPADYEEALHIIGQAAPQLRGVEFLFIPDFIEVNGLAPDRYELSIKYLALVTPYSSSEFAVRPFIQRYPLQTIKQLMEWTESSDEHIRRLASEGSRPRLPWGAKLGEFIADPTPVLPILHALRQDNSLYVRKSVANHLNDISKDHADLVLDLAQSWHGQHPHTDWIIRHASRSLLKKGHPAALSLFGYNKQEAVHIENLKLERDTIATGEELHFSFDVVNTSGEPQMLRIEYEIGYMKANGKQAPKRFKCSDRMYPEGRTPVATKQSFKLITTRKFYAGLHTLTIVVNGQEMQTVSFVLEVD